MSRGRAPAAAVRREPSASTSLASLALVGALLRIFSPAFLFPVGVALGYGESPWPFVAGGSRPPPRR